MWSKYPNALRNHGFFMMEIEYHRNLCGRVEGAGTDDLLSPCFLSPLIKPDMPLSSIRLCRQVSSKGSRVRVAGRATQPDNTQLAEHRVKVKALGATR
jgi:hypothetical protein